MLVGVEVEEQLLHLVHDLGDAGVAAVDLVDHEDDGQARLERLAQHEPGLGQRALAGVDEQEHAVDHREPPLDLAAEVGVAGGVDDVDLHAAVAHRGVLGEDRDALLALEVGRVHDPVDDLLVGAERAGLAQHGVDERGLAVVDVGDDGDVADVGAACGDAERWRDLSKSGGRGTAHREAHKSTGASLLPRYGKGCTLAIRTNGEWLMYLFTRSRRVDPGDFAKAMESVVEITDHARKVTGQQIDAWSAVMSPEVGTIVWTLWAEGLAQIEQAGDALVGDSGFMKLVEKTDDHFDGPYADGVATFGARRRESRRQRIRVRRRRHRNPGHRPTSRSAWRPASRSRITSRRSRATTRCSW